MFKKEMTAREYLEMELGELWEDEIGLLQIQCGLDVDINAFIEEYIEYNEEDEEWTCKM